MTEPLLLTAATVAGIILVAWWGHRVTRHRKYHHTANLNEQENQ